MTATAHRAPDREDQPLEALGLDAMRRWTEEGGEGPVEMAREGRVIELDG
jgi:hypothetical protein